MDFPHNDRKDMARSATQWCLAMPTAPGDTAYTENIAYIWSIMQKIYEDKHSKSI